MTTRGQSTLDYGTRRVRHEAHTRVVEANAEGGSAARAGFITAYRTRLVRLMRRLGVGQTFQAVDVLREMNAAGELPEGVDLRCIGGLFPKLQRGKLVRVVGHEPNGGIPARNYNSTVRPVFEIRALDFTVVGWGDPV